MMVYRLLVLSIYVLIFSHNLHATSILVSESDFFDSVTGDASGYGLNQWTNMTVVMDSATGNNVDVVSNFENLELMLAYDSIWLDLRMATLSTSEIDNISTYINTGRKVVMVGENFFWGGLNTQITELAGGTYILPDYYTGVTSTVVTNDLTYGVDTIDVISGGLATGGVSLFSENVLTLWGDGNVLTMLDSGICSDGAWNSSDNAVFCGNLANWAADSSSVSSVPIPAAVWLFGSGLLGLIGVARRKQ